MRVIYCLEKDECENCGKRDFPEAMFKGSKLDSKKKKAGKKSQIYPEPDSEDDSIDDSDNVFEKNLRKVIEQCFEDEQLIKLSTNKKKMINLISDIKCDIYRNMNDLIKNPEELTNPYLFEE